MNRDRDRAAVRDEIRDNTMSTGTPAGISPKKGADHNVVTGNVVSFTGATRGQAVADNGSGNTVSGNMVR